MPVKQKVKQQKTIFQVRYEPQLRFYDLLNSVVQRFEGFPHWSTNGLKTTLRDYKLRHNISIGHDSTSYETDAPNKDVTAGMINSIVENLKHYVRDGEVVRIGLRNKYLIPVTMQQPELEAILNGKLLNLDFLRMLVDEPQDMTIVLVGTRGEYSYRVTVGPITQEELPRFLEFTVEHHLDPKDREITLASLYKDLPGVSLYIDFDCFRRADDMTLKDVSSFVENAPLVVYKYIQDLSDFIFNVDV